MIERDEYNSSAMSKMSQTVDFGRISPSEKQSLRKSVGKHSSMSQRSYSQVSQSESKIKKSNVSKVSKRSISNHSRTITE